MPIVNPYEAKIQSLEASLPGELHLTLADLFRAEARAYDEGMKAGETLRNELYEALKAWDEYVSSPQASLGGTNYPANMRLKQIAVDRMERTIAKVEEKED